MRNWKKLLLTVVPVSLAMTFQAYAGQWHQDMNGWWYETDDGGYLANGWNWLDGNQDGTAECYYFGTDGYLITEHGYADGYRVDANGAWMENGKVQRKTVEVSESAAHKDDAAAADSTDPMAVYLAAQEKANALDSMDMSADYEISFTAGDITMDMTMDMNIKMKGIQEGPLQFTADGSMGLLGTEIPVNMFYTDGYYYMDMMGMKVKEAMLMDDAMAEVRSSVEATEIDRDMMENLQMRTEGENTIISYTVNAAYMNDYLNRVVGEGFDEAYGDITYQIRSANGEAVINKDGYSEKETVYMDMDMTAVNPDTGVPETISYKITVHATVNNPGQPVEVVIPSTEGYEETASLGE